MKKKLVILLGPIKEEKYINFHKISLEQLMEIETHPKGWFVFEGMHIQQIFILARNRLQYSLIYE